MSADSSRLHVRYKVATWLAGRVASPAMRPPMPPPLEEEVATLRALLLEAGVKPRTDT